MDMQAPIMRGDYVSDETDYRDALPVNYTVVVKEVRGAKGYLLSHPGLIQHSTGEGKDRAGYWNERQGRHYRVSGNELISLAANGDTTFLGAISGANKASMAHSFNNQSIVVDGKWYLYNGTTLTQITDSDLGVPIDHVWIDSYFFFTDGENIYHSLITDETQIDPLQFATSEYSPDPTLGVAKTADDLVIVFDRYTTAYFINQATDNFAFSFLKSKTVKCGIVATHCKVELEETFFIIGSGRNESLSIFAIDVGTYTSIASREIDKILATYTDADLFDASLESRIVERDRFIIANLPNHTLLFNMTVAEQYGKDQAWTIVKSGIEDDTPWRGINGVFDPRVGWIYGDRVTDDIGFLDNGIATQYGNQVENILYTPFITLEEMSINEVEFSILPGHQAMSSPVTSFISLSYNGVTYGTEYTQTTSTQHDYDLRLIYFQLGYVRQFVSIKLRTVSGERLAISRCMVDYS
jgi:hypothetical protein